MTEASVIVELVRVGFTLIASALLLALGWFIGLRLTYKWNIRQKRREIQLSASQSFYSSYGEFFAIWKLWNRVDHKAPSFDDRRWELYKRAAAVEGVIEGILVKLCSELTLCDEELKILGSFRQAFQQLRDSIRDQKPLAWTHSEHPSYVVFKTLAVQVASLLEGVNKIV